MTAKGVPTGTRSPIPATRLSTVPVWNDSTSIRALSVSITATVSPLRIRSPGLTSHSATVPDSMSAPSEGITNSHRSSVMR